MAKRISVTEKNRKRKTTFLKKIPTGKHEIKCTAKTWRLLGKWANAEMIKKSRGKIIDWLVEDADEREKESVE